MIVPGSVNPLMLGDEASGNYQISNSLRFQSASSQYLSRTPSVAGNRQKFTYSIWVKRGALSSDYRQLLSAGASGTDRTAFMFDGGAVAVDSLFFIWNSGASNYGSYTSAIFRDPSAWYHIVLAVDTTQATAANRIIIYVNGNQQTTNAYTSGYVPQNTNLNINNNIAQFIGSNPSYGLGNYLDGYLAEVNFIDGQALTPSSFGTTDPTSGQWVAKKYTGTYGTNGFYLPFSNGTSTTTLGADSSGNGNNWTLTNFTRSAGVSDCWMYDVPSGNGGASGTQPSSNYAVLNPLKNGGLTVSNANLNAVLTGATDNTILASIGMKSGKWYWEITCTNTVNIVGIANDKAVIAGNYCGQNANSWGYYSNNGNKINNASFVAYGSTYTTNDVIGVAFDADAGSLTFYKNNVSQGTAYSGLTSDTYFPAVGNSSTSCAINFGQRSFAYTPPSGFKALCTSNLPVATIKQGNKYMDATLYTGNNTGQAVVNAGAFKPDFLWIKARSNTYSHVLADSVRGVSAYLNSDLTAAEGTNSELTSFNSNGFTLGATGSQARNVSGQTYVGWQWQAGQGSTSSNTNGSITSTVSVNATAGFSIVTYTGTGANATVGHGLGVAPKMIIAKIRDAVDGWGVYHASLGNTQSLSLESTGAAATSSTYWNSTSPTSSVFSIGTWSRVNVNAKNFVAYCFAEIAGYSKFGSYIGNGSADGPFVYCGFIPKFVMVKNTGVGPGDWIVIDSARGTYNVVTQDLFANSSSAENSGTYLTADFVANGFKIRSSNGDGNNSADKYIFMAFAENPFQNSNAR